MRVCHRQQLLDDLGYKVEDSNAQGSVGVNWKMTAKTILAQMVQKSELFSEMNKNLVLICQTPLYKYMESNFNFAKVRAVADYRDVLHFHVYDYTAVSNRMELSLAFTRSASLETVKEIMGMNPDASKAYDEIIETLKSRLSPEYLFNSVPLA